MFAVSNLQQIVSLAANGIRIGAGTLNARAALCAVVIVAALTLLNAVFNSVATTVGLGYPYSTFLFEPGDAFADFFKLLLSYPDGKSVNPADAIAMRDLLELFLHSKDYAGVEGLGTRTVTHLHLTPFSTALALISAKLMHRFDPVLLFLGFNFLLFLYVCRTSWGAGRSRWDGFAWILLGLISYPWLLTVTRGNLFAGVTAVALIHALLLAYRQKGTLLTPVLLALAVSVRPNAIIFIIVFLAFAWPNRAKLLKFLIAFCLVAVAMNVASILAATHIYPDYNLANFAAGLGHYFDMYAIGKGGLAFGSSLYGALKLMLGYNSLLNPLASAFDALLCLAAILLYAFKQLTRAELLFITCASYCLGSTVFGDYHLLVFLAVPMVQALERAELRSRLKPSSPYIAASMIVVSCLMLAPKNYLFHNGISYQVVLNPLLLILAAIIILGAAMFHAWPRRRVGMQASHV